MSGSGRFDQQLRCGARADRDDAVIFALQLHRVGCGVARFHFHRLARLQIVALDEAQERRILIGDPRHGQRLSDRARQQRVELARGDRAFRVGNRIAVRVVRRVAEHIVDALDEALRYDVLVNYRYQLIDEGPGHPAVAPRLSVILPTGRAESGVGHGVVGLQMNVPASKQSGNLYLHGNAGWTWLPRVKSPLTDSRASLFSPHVGGSVIWRAAPMLNVMLESLLEFEQFLDADGAAIRERTVTISPGLRGGWNIGPRQLVVGAALPVSRSQGESSVALLTYFSYELPFKN